MGAATVVDGDCPWSLSRKRAHYGMTLKGHLEGAINLQMNMSATFHEGSKGYRRSGKTKSRRQWHGKKSIYSSPLCAVLKLSLSLVQKRLSVKREHNFSSFNLVLLILIKCLKQCY